LAILLQQEGPTLQQALILTQAGKMGQPGGQGALGGCDQRPQAAQVRAVCLGRHRPVHPRQRLLHLLVQALGRIAHPGAQRPLPL
jgi:hypothetical protein